MDTDFGLEAGDVDARMVGKRLGGAEALGQRRKAAGVLERIARRHHPPHPVETEPVHGDQAGGTMRRVRRIEGAAEQADPHARQMRRKMDHEGRALLALSRLGESDMSDMCDRVRNPGWPGRGGRGSVTAGLAPSRGPGT